MIGKVNVAFRYFFSVRLGTGLPATGVAPGDFTVTVRNPQNTATMAAPTVVEVGGGLYYFDISATFSNTHGAGQYGVTIAVDSTTPRVRDTGGQTVDFYAQDIDDLAVPGDAMDLVADAVDASAVATSGAQEIRDEILDDATRFSGADIGATLADTNEMQGKLPTNNIMGSLVKTGKDDEIDAILADTAAMQPLIDQSLSTTESNIRGTDNRDLTEIAGASFAAADNLHNAKIQRDAIQSDISDIQNNTRFSASIPILERPLSGTAAYKIRVNLEDTSGNPEDPDASTINVNVTNQAGASRNLNLSSTTMTKLAVGRYEVTYNVASSHALEQLLFEFSYAENTIAFTRDRSSTVVDATEVGFTAADRADLQNVLADTNETQGKLPTNNIMGSSVKADKDTAIDAILADTAVIEPIVSANLDAQVSTRATQAQILSDATPLPGANIDAAISSRATPADVTAAQNAIIARLNQLNVAAESTVVAGSTATNIRTGLTQADDFFNSMQLVVINMAGVVVRNVNDYANANGEFTVDILPFTPAPGDVVIVLARTGSVLADIPSIVSGVWSEGVPGGYGIGSAGFILGTLLDAAVSTRATPTEVKTQADQALIDYDPPTFTEMDDGHTAIIAAVNTRAVPGDAMTLTAGERAAVVSAIWAHVVDGNTLGLTAEETLDLSRKVLNNRLELADGDTNNWTLYNDDDSTPLLRYSVTDKSGAQIVQPSLFPSRRTRGV